ncbi:MAG: DUF4923 family protein [Ruminococcus sp.]|nr:DUF4923 family protein [Ruminococcus sp.]
MKFKILCVLCAILCAVALVFSGCGSSDENSITGTWVTNSPAFIDGGDSPVNGSYYYTFEEDGKASVTTGTFSIVGDWHYVDDDGKKTDALTEKVKIEVKTMISGTFSVKIKPDDKKSTLTITDKSGTSMTLTSSELPKAKNKVDDNFKAVDYITGKWQELDSDEVVYTFNSDGTCSIVQTDLSIEGTYTVDEKNNVIEITYLDNNQQNSWNIPFLVKDGEKGQKITFANSVFKKIG